MEHKAAHLYVVFGKFFSAMSKGLAIGERTIEADGYDINEAGVLTFWLCTKHPWGSENRYIKSIPPGMWIDVEEIVAEEPGTVNGTSPLIVTE